jgi:hypothetical protein
LLRAQLQQLLFKLRLLGFDLGVHRQASVNCSSLKRMSSVETHFPPSSAMLSDQRCRHVFGKSFATLGPMANQCAELL